MIDAMINAGHWLYSKTLECSQISVKREIKGVGGTASMHRICFICVDTQCSLACHLNF